MESRREAQGAAQTRASIHDIAARAGVSAATVSRVLNGRPDVSESTRKLVLRHVRELGYVSNRSARALVSGRSGLIGMTVPYVIGDYFSQIIAGTTDALVAHGANLVICRTQHERGYEMSLLERLMHGTSDGAILVLPSESNEALAQLRKRGFPFVVIDPPITLDPEIPMISVSNLAGARSATEHLIALGHRRIATITGPKNWISTVDRLSGYQMVLQSNGLAYDPALVVYSDYTIPGGYHAAQHVLGMTVRPTAILAQNDNMAMGVLQAARERGIRIPDDISLVGFDDSGIASLTTPALTSVRQPLQEMGRLAVMALYRQLDGLPLDAARVELSTRLIVRESTAPPTLAIL